ncbi:MAG: sporulation protein YunB [Oscillospiraceae bacterium]
MKIKRYRPRYAKRAYYKIFVIFMAILICIVLIDAKVRPLIRTIAASQASNLATVAINDAINEIMDENSITYNDLVTIDNDGDGRVTSVKTDIIKINRLKASISTRISDKLSKIQNKQIKIPIGSLMGNQLLAGRGPSIKLYINLSGNAETQISNKFYSAGINQTIHRIMLDITANIYTVLPGANSTSQVKTSVSIAETVIVGNVPDTYGSLYGIKGMTQK